MTELINNIFCSDSIEFMTGMNENSIDLIVTSPPYGVGIDYDSWDDDKQFEEYKDFSREWLVEAFRVLK